MKVKVIAALVFASTLAAGFAAAQPAAFNDIGVTMGHWHIASKDMEANKKLFLAMGAKMYMPDSNPLMVFPGIHINLVGGGGGGKAMVPAWGRWSTMSASSSTMCRSVPPSGRPRA